MTTLALSESTLRFWQAQVTQLAEWRSAYLAAGRPDWAAKLEPMHALAVRRCAAARREWFRVTDDAIWLRPCQAFWDSRPDIG